MKNYFPLPHVTHSEFILFHFNASRDPLNGFYNPFQPLYPSLEPACFIPCVGLIYPHCMYVFPSSPSLLSLLSVTGTGVRASWG